MPETPSGADAEIAELGGFVGGAPGTVGQTLPWLAYFPACTSSNLSFPTAQDGWTIQDFDFQAFADPAGNVMFYNAQQQ